MLHRHDCSCICTSPGDEKVEHAVCTSSGVVLLFQYPLDAHLELRDSDAHVLAAVISPKAQFSNFGDD